jgi:hypothetical protein
MKLAADTLSVQVCDACGRTDRFAGLPKRHFTQGGLCKGNLHVVTYRKAGSKPLEYNA